MNRQRWFLTVMAMVMGLALAGTAVAQTQLKAPFKGDPCVGAVPVKPVSGLKLTQTHLSLVNASNVVVAQVNTTPLTTVAITKGFSYKVRIQLKNNNSAAAAAKTIQMHVIGGTFDASTGYQTDQKLNLSVPAVAATCTITKETQFVPTRDGWHQFVILQP